MASPAPVSIFQNAVEGEKLAAAMNQFSWDFFKELAKSNPGNLFYSPVSINVAMAMTYLGARGNTATELSKVLGLDTVQQEHLHAAFEDLNARLQMKNPNLTLRMANRHYVKQGLSVLPEFVALSKAHYKVEAVPADFAGNAEAVSREINQWVEEQTAQKIRDLIPPGALNSLTAMVLVNAITAAGDWEKKFDATVTLASDFYPGGDDETISVKMMHQKKKFEFGFSRDLGCLALELPYLGGELSMLLLLPKEKGRLAEVEGKLTAEHIRDWKKTFHGRSMDVNVHLPRFKFEQSFNLSQHLSAMGIRELFQEGTADLSGIDGSKLLFVSEVFHKAFIEVNEEGSEAAAATAAVIQLRCMPQVGEFNANHPFLFFIRDRPSGTILFSGRMARPE